MALLPKGIKMVPLCNKSSKNMNTTCQEFIYFAENDYILINSAFLTFGIHKGLSMISDFTTSEITPMLCCLDHICAFFPVNLLVTFIGVISI